jgi:CubicO group peptidase (beta-lactamase class C family)
MSAVIDHGIEEQLHLGAQVYISLQGEPVADVGIGKSRPGVAMTNKSITKWLSAVKPICAVAIARLRESGHLDWDDKVTDYISEFGSKGKEDITIRHLLTHTSGIRHISTKKETWELHIAEICEGGLYPDWIPGEKAGYAVSLGWMILAEILQRVDGRHYDQYAHDEILLPLQMTDTWISVSPALFESYGDQMSLAYTSKKGKLEHLEWDSPDEGLYWPGGSARGPVRELGHFYEMLLFDGERDGVRILSSESVHDITSVHRSGMLDTTFKQTIDWGFGFLIDSKSNNPDGHDYGYGTHASSNTFGHGGFQSAIGFADPDKELVVSWAFNGLPGDAAHRKRNHTMNTAIYEDLGLGGRT